MILSCLISFFLSSLFLFCSLFDDLIFPSFPLPFHHNNQPKNDQDEMVENQNDDDKINNNSFYIKL